jgi:UDP-2,4-diacetamido-2,4,6-trideoxy-beta-L-altropyranose hydrolase
MRILIRADGDSSMGTGHIMRMIALAQQAVAEDGAAWMASVRLPSGLQERLSDVGVPLLSPELRPGTRADVEWVRDRARQLDVEWIVADGYAFAEEFQEATREAGLRLLLVDDHGHCERYSADLVLNQNASADERLYKGRAEQTRLLLGTEYALLRREFLERQGRAREVPARARNLLVTMGGADPVDATRTVLAALRELEDPELHAIVLIGPSNARGDRLAAEHDDPRIEIRRGVSDMPEFMEWADLAVAAAGSTTWELAFMGAPTLLVVLADNQLEVARAMDSEGACVDLGWHHQLTTAGLCEAVQAICEDRPRRAELARRAREKVDGRGGARVLAAMRACEPRRGRPC